MEIVGCTVAANGRVTIFDNIGAGVSQYVVQDRTLSTKWAIKVSNGVINIVSSSSSISAEPVLSDSLLSGVFWRVFVDNGVIGVEAANVVDNDEVYLIDTVTSTVYKIIVSDGVLGNSVQSATSEVFTFADNTSKQGTSNFYYIDGITTSGITDGFIIVRGVNRLGQPINQLIDVSTSVPCRFYKQNGRIKMQKSGQNLSVDYKIMLEPEVDIREEDLVYPLSDVVGLTIGQTIFVEKIWDFDGITHHTEIGVNGL